jgi:hypothetical protein
MNICATDAQFLILYTKPHYLQGFIAYLGAHFIAGLKMVFGPCGIIGFIFIFKQ